MMAQTLIPKNPAKPPANMNISLINDSCWANAGRTYEAVAVIPTTIMSGDEISPLLTAASPIISPPAI